MAHSLGFIAQAAKAGIESPTMRCGSEPTTRRRPNNPNAATVKHIQPFPSYRQPLFRHSGPALWYGNILKLVGRADWSLRQRFHPGRRGRGLGRWVRVAGCIAGCAAAGSVADFLGRKRVSRLWPCVFVLSSVGILFARTFISLFFGGLIGGVGIGAASVLSPNYIAEIAPTRVRGRCVTLYQLGLWLEFSPAVFVNMLIQRTGDEAWNFPRAGAGCFLPARYPRFCSES